MTELMIYLVLLALMLFAAYSDLTRMLLPNWISLVLVFGFFLVSLALKVPPLTIAVHLGCGALAFALGYGLFWFRMIGGGDVKFFAASMVWMGVERAVLFMFFMSLFGAVIAILKGFFLMIRYRDLTLHERMRLILKTPIPYGVAIALAFGVTYPMPLSFG